MDKLSHHGPVSIKKNCWCEGTGHPSLGKNLDPLMCWCKAESNLECIMEEERWQILIASAPAAAVDYIPHSTVPLYFEVIACHDLEGSDKIDNSGSRFQWYKEVRCVKLLCALCFILSAHLSPLPWQPAARKCNLIAFCLSCIKCLLSVPHHPISPLLLYGIPVRILVNYDWQTWRK